MRKKIAVLAVVAALNIAPAIARALEGPATQQSTRPASETLKATITAVQGLVQVRDAEDKPWRKAEVGMVVLEDAEFRTGPKSAVQFTLPPDQTVTLDRLGTVKLIQAIKQNGKIITNLGMKYGRTRYDIEAAGQEHESTISSPSSTLAVRGTKVSLYDQRPFNVEAVSLTGRASFRDGKKQLAFGNKGQGKTVVAAGTSSAASFSLDQAVIDPTLALARTGTESTLISTLISRGSTLSFDRTTGIKVVTGGVPPLDAQLIPALPGQLNFVLRWDTNSDLNLSIGSPGGKNNAGEVLYPIAGLDQNRSGGKIDFDHRGGPNGGIEIAYWKGAAPAGLYSIGVVLASGPATNANVEVFRGGQLVEFFDGTANVTSSTFFVIPPTPGVSNGTLAGIAGIDATVPGAPGGTEPGAPPPSTGEPGEPPAVPGEPGAPPIVAAAKVAATATIAATPQTAKSTQTVTSTAKSTAATSKTATRKK